MTTNKQYKRLHAHKIKAYRWLYEFTAKSCTDCAQTDCACKDSICRHVEEQNLRRGEKFQHTGHRLRFIGCAGCVVPPHLRETCTIYLCEKAKAKPEFRQRRYLKLKNLCASIEEKIMLLEESKDPGSPT